MNFAHVSQFPILRGGRVRDPSFDYGHTQNCNVVWFNGRHHVYWKGLEALPETTNPPRLGLGYIDPDGFDETAGVTRTPFDGRTLKLEATNPIVDFTSAARFPSGTAAPLDVYTNGGLTAGGRIGDIAAVVHGGKVKLYCNVYNYNNAGTNRLALIESADGKTFSFVQEITYSGVGFGRTMGPVWDVGGTLWALFGQAHATRGFYKVLMSSADGLTWALHGTAIPLSNDPAAFNYYGMPVGRAFVHGAYAVAAVPGSRHTADWPEGIGLWRKPLASLGDGLPWEEYPRNPVALRDPTKGGLWQANLFFAGPDLWALCNTWGMVGFENIDSATLNTMRGAPYYDQDVTGFKHVAAMRATNRFALDDWAYDPIGDGGLWQLRHGDLYLASGQSAPAAGGAVTVIADRADARTLWRIDRQSGFYLLRPAAAPALAVQPDGGAHNRARGMNLVLGATDPADAVNNIPFHWHLPLTAGSEPLCAALVNRHSSLALPPTIAQDVALGSARDQWRLLPVI